MLDTAKLKQKALSRKKIIISVLVILALSLGLGSIMYGLADSFEEFADIRILQIVFLVLFPLFTLVLWVPLCLGGGQIYELREDAFVIIPAYKAVSYTHLDVYKRQVYVIVLESENEIVTVFEREVYHGEALMEIREHTERMQIE